MPLTIVISDDVEESTPKFCRKCTKTFESTYHVNVCHRVGTSPPDPSLGSNLETIAHVREWLGHPSNQLQTTLFIVRWVGNVPKISVHHVNTLFEEPRGLAEIILIEHIKRKRGINDLMKDVEE